MTFANMTTTERMRASGLIGLIVIILFFVVHTMLGALAPKPQNGAAPPPELAQGPGAPPSQISPSTADTQPVAGAWQTPDKAFQPKDDPGPGDVTKTSSLESAPTGDPFVPLRPTDIKTAPVKPEITAPGPTLTASRALPGPFGGNAAVGGMGGLTNTPTVPDPEIKVVGVVEGEQSIATIEVGGRARNVRPGESLARSYRLETVYGDGVRVRHDKKSYLIRVGNAINDSKMQ